MFRLYRQSLLLLGAFLVYALTGVGTKLSSQCAFLSLPYVSCVLLVVLFLAVYAVMWQKILTFMPLNKAYLCKSICIVITLAISYFMFSETLTLYNLLGAALIIGGIAILSTEQ